MLQQARVSIFEGLNRPLQTRLVPLPTLGDGEMLVRVGLTTICGSDLHSFDGRREVPVPTILGHEILGTIVDIGPRTPPVDAAGQPLAVGDRVTWSLVVSCGGCFYCQRDLQSCCNNPTRERVSEGLAYASKRGPRLRVGLVQRKSRRVI